MSAGAPHALTRLHTLHLLPPAAPAFCLQDDAEIRWFTLKKGQLAYDPDTCNFFALKQVTQSEVDEWVARAEKEVLGAKA